MNTSIRWKQQYNNFVTAMGNVREVLEGIADSNNLTLIEKLAMLKAFEFGLEMAKKTIKQYFLEQEGSTLTTVEAIRTAFKFELIENPAWGQIIEFRNNTVHDYDKAVLDESIEKIIHQLIPALAELENNLRNRAYSEE